MEGSRKVHRGGNFPVDFVVNHSKMNVMHRITSLPRRFSTSLTGRGRCSLRRVPALAENWRARDARLQLPSGLHRSRVSEMRRYAALMPTDLHSGRSFARIHPHAQGSGREAATIS